jgi:phage protein D
VATKEKRTGKGKKKKQERVQANPNPDNVKVLGHTYASRSNAERAARAEWQEIQRGVATFTSRWRVGGLSCFPRCMSR